MRAISLFRLTVLSLFLLAWQAPAFAQTGPTPRQIQGMIAAGQEAPALDALHNVLQAHPDSGIAWYLVAEAQDAQGNTGPARDALAKAEQYAPGLPFAKPGEVAALQAHLAPHGAAAGGGMGPVAVVIGVFVLLFLGIRFFLRSRRGFGPYGGGFQNGFNDGRPNMPFGPQGGGGLGSSIISGLAAGAGFAAGERIIDGMLGGDRGGFIQPGGNSGVPDRDDGLSGSPGWDNGGSDNSGIDDSNNSW